MSQLLHRRLHFRSTGWTPPSGRYLWLAYLNSGSVSAGGTWNDASGSGNNFTLYGNAVVDSSGLLIPANDGYAGIASITPPATLTLWVYIHAYASLNCIVGGTGSNYSIDMRSGPVWSSSGNFNFGTLVENTWQFIALRKGGDGDAAWLGASKTSDNVFRPLCTELGRLNATYPRNIHGSIDDVQYYSAALSDAQVDDIRTNSPAKRG